MTTSNNHILVPVNLDEQSLCLARQAAELAGQSGATIHLLHVPDKNEYPGFFLRMFTERGLNEYYNITQQKNAMLNTWKRLLEQQYGIDVKIIVDWGDWKSRILKYSKLLQVSVIALREDHFRQHAGSFGKSVLESVVEKSPCQVVTFLNEKKSKRNWHQVVLPVTDYIPEIWLHAIRDLARSLKLKVHLVTMAGLHHSNGSSDFYYLTESIKRLIPNANIQVECRCLSSSSHALSSFLEYAHAVDADMLMTNKRSGPAKRFNALESAEAKGYTEVFAGV
jgi:nucleotide-binding universal stress UspA family protein